MRVITGTAKGRKLKAPKGMETRPTTDRTKESLFNIIGLKAQDAYILDLFAGTGAIGIEALSRGAEKAVFVEHNSQAVKIINDNLTLTRLAEKAEILTMDSFRALERLAAANRPFDIIFIDPPYLKDLEKKALKIIDHHKLLTSEGVVITESSKRDQMPEKIETLQLVRQEKYGDSILSFYQHTEPKT